MLSDTARPLFGGPDGTPSGRQEQERTVEVATAVTSLVAYKESCGTTVKNCPRESTLSFWSLDDGLFHLVRVVCKTWACTYCGPIKRAHLAVRVKAAKPNRFVTLTAAPDQTESPREVFDRTRRQISELAKVYRREGKEFEFLRVLEVHQSGFPHYHLIVRSPWLDQKELSHRWCCLTQSYIVDVRKLSNDDKGVNYVMKYLGKQEKNAFTNRRVSWTKNFFAPEPKPPPSERQIAEVERWSGSLEDVTHWEFPDSTWERVNHWHWIKRSKSWSAAQTQAEEPTTPEPF